MSAPMSASTSASGLVSHAGLRRTPDYGVLAALLPPLILGGILLTWLPTFAAAEDFNGARASLPAEAAANNGGQTAGAPRAAQPGRLTNNGTRMKSENQTSSDVGSPQAAPVKPAARTTGSVGTAQAAASTEAAASSRTASARAPAAEIDNGRYVSMDDPKNTPSLGSTGCLAGCFTPLASTGRSTHSTAAAAMPTAANAMQIQTHGELGGSTCIAGCYGLSTETTPAQTADASAKHTPVAAEEASDKPKSVSVLRGATRRRMYSGG